ncbi:MAG: pantoate--beta-alanine ligase [Jatrophihabitans sp.]
MVVARRRAELASARAALPGSVGAVFTMGALHDGHRALLTAAREQDDSLVATIFVNPLQFGPAEDLSRYPQSLEADLALCEQAGVDLVWVPEVDDVYVGGLPRVSVDPGPLATDLEGASRPGHFAGVLTVVCKLLHLTAPMRSYFGQKDYQQIALVRRMVHDLDLGADIVEVPTVREADGLARSSRNVYLDEAQRAAAVALSAALRASADAARIGSDRDTVLNVGRQLLAAEPGVAIDYYELRAPDLSPAPEHGEARMLVAARVGSTRLIDNYPVELR